MNPPTEEERRKLERCERGRFIRPSALNGWQATPKGLLLIYADFSRELLEMPEQEAADNAIFLSHEKEQEIVCITWDDLPTK